MISNNKVRYLNVFSMWKFISWEWILSAKNSSKLMSWLTDSNWLNLYARLTMTSWTCLSLSRPKTWLNNAKKGLTLSWKTCKSYGKDNLSETWSRFNNLDMNPNLTSFSVCLNDLIKFSSLKGKDSSKFDSGKCRALLIDWGFILHKTREAFHSLKPYFQLHN